MRHWAGCLVLMIGYPFAVLRLTRPARWLHALACKVAGEPNRLED